ncbi:MAG: nucleoside kinase [Clostridia bacterium]|nr:nucleoside kinase [Clostridia bacterium]
MKYFNVNIINGNMDVSVDANASLLELSKLYKNVTKYPILAAKVDNIERDLNYRINDDCIVEFLDITSKLGFRVYQRSAVFIMLAAVRKILGKKAVVWVEHTINDNYFCTIRDVEITQKLLSEIKAEMLEMVKSDFTIEKMQVSVSEAEEIFTSNNLINCKCELKYIKATSVTIYKMNDYYDYLYGSMVPSTDYIKIFNLVRHSDGFVLQFESSKTPGTLNTYLKYPKLTSIFKEYNKWSEILNVSAVCSLNDAISNSEIKELILIAEALQEKKIANIADAIHKSGKKFVFIAGPSSSGKTTFSKRLCIQLKVIGIKPHVISLDDYYKPREEIPFEADGTRNFENINTLEIEKFNNDLLKLKDGEEVETPLYDFATGEPKAKGKKIRLDKEDVLVIEGIHGLNDVLTPKIKAEDKFKIYISALTQLNIDEHNRISTTDTRLIRRIVRDHFFRGFSASNTINMWPTVLKGEEENIFPFQENADVTFNSALIYEMCVLKVFAEPLLFNMDKSESGYTEAKRLLNLLNSFLAVNPQDIPSNSLIREFVGGSCFD